MADNSKKWFDFGPGISLSVVQKNGGYLLRLEMAHKLSPALVNKVHDAKWALVQSAQDGRPAVYEHMKDVRSLSDVAKRLEAFFDKERIMGALTVTTRPPTKVEARSRSPQDVSDSVLSAFADGTPAPLLQHINRSIQHAFAVMGARSAAAKQLPFEGDAFGVYDRLVAKTGEQRAAEIWGSVLLSVSSTKHGWQEKLDRLMEWDAGGREAEIAIDPTVKALVEAVTREVATVNATGLAQVDLATALRGRLVEAAGERISYRAYDGASFHPKGAPDLGPNTFTVQQGLSLDLATDAKARITQALAASAKAMGLPRDRLFGNESVKFFFAPDMGRGRSEDRGSATLYRANEDVQLHAIHIVPTRPGALLHEIGHQIHNVGDRDFILEKVRTHKFAQSTRRIVSALEEKGIISPQYATYLTEPAEIFARAFEAYVVASQSPDQTGGSLSSVGAPSFTPTGEELTTFMTNMRAVIMASRSDLDRGDRPSAVQARAVSAPRMGM
ncbi:hypothetical protein A6U87_27250 [Rhizobium sp. AC44/96]|uniref:hypothetical protein n=1 Tax=Rhizobium/Agrobacterium group TaxID=227290 RepID=UPI00080FBC1D|nr:hypothetical protein [Rhizobium sp. AC44/96]OCJ11443.1 hypothetical protein A6U87_27250 [Rhizobium sp. AC44/96]